MADPAHAPAPRTGSGPITAEPRPLAVVIPTWNGGPRFRELLRVLAAQDVPGGFQLVVVDSGSRDGSADAARAAGALVHTIPQAEFNHGATRNLAISLANRAEVVALLTQDALPMDAGYLSALRRPFDDPTVDGAYARQFPQADCDPLLAERLRRWSASREEPVVQSLAPGDPAAARARYDALAPLERLMACAFDNVASALRRSTWQQHPFPEASFGEDVSWAKEVQLAGGSIAFVPDARVEHSHRISIRREFKRLYCDHQNLYRLFELRSVPSWSAVRAGWRHQARFYGELLDGQGQLSPIERWRWKRYAAVYALFETTAQFLGARSHWKRQESRFWNWFDQRIRRGV